MKNAKVNAFARPAPQMPFRAPACEARRSSQVQHQSTSTAEAHDSEQKSPNMQHIRPRNAAEASIIAVVFVYRKSAKVKAFARPAWRATTRTVPGVSSKPASWHCGQLQLDRSSWPRTPQYSETLVKRTGALIACFLGLTSHPKRTRFFMRRF